MPELKVPASRVKILNNYFKNHKYTFKELLEKTNNQIESLYGSEKRIDIRTLRSDIKYFREELDAEGILITDSNNLYYYNKKTFDPLNKVLSDFDIKKVKEAAELLKQIKGFDIYDDLIQVYNQLENRIATDGENDPLLIQFDSKSEVAGREYLDDLLDAIRNKNVIQFEYRAFNQDFNEDVVLHPYLLKEYNSRWYVIGKPNGKNEIYNYALDRFQSKRIKFAKGFQFEPTATFIAEDYFKNIIGVTLPLNSKVEKVVLQFVSSRAPYIETAFLHSSQIKKKTTKDYVQFEYMLIVNKELQSLILSFGKDVKVIKPLHLQKSILENYEIALTQY